MEVIWDSVWQRYHRQVTMHSCMIYARTSFCYRGSIQCSLKYGSSCYNECIVPLKISRFIVCQRWLAWHNLEIQVMCNKIISKESWTNTPIVVYPIFKVPNSSRWYLLHPKVRLLNAPASNAVHAEVAYQNYWTSPLLSHWHSVNEILKRSLTIPKRGTIPINAPYKSICG